MAGSTTWDALVLRGKVKLGETVLIHGGAGGVGHFGIQLAKAAGLMSIPPAAITISILSGNLELTI
jgi:NADPH:quinone reductase-like Zn-dependent oxidoreductase